MRMTSKFRWLLTILFAVPVLLYIIFHHGIMPFHRHTPPASAVRNDVSPTLVASSFRELTAQQALHTSHEPIFVSRNPPGINLSVAPETQFAPQETFLTNGVIRREDTAISSDGRLRPYFGNLHAHTGWSDGKGDPVAAFRHARDVAHVDFFAVTDHPEYWLFGAEDKWQMLKEIAGTFTGPNFVAMRGFEYSSPVFGHYTVINSETVCTAYKCPTLKDFYNWVDRDPSPTIAVFFSHPLQQKDNATAYEFAKFALPSDLGLHSTAAANVLNKFKGIEVIHWGGYRHFLDGFSGGQPFIDEALLTGWRIGSVATQDNHGWNWGNGGTNQLALLMSELTPQSVNEAIASKRFYATSSRFLNFSVEINVSSESWLPMGSQVRISDLPAGPLTFIARYFEPNPEHIPHIFEWILNGQVISQLDFVRNETLALTLNNRRSYAGEVHLALPRDLLVEHRVNYLYARFKQGLYQDAFTQSSPIFLLPSSGE